MKPTRHPSSVPGTTVPPTAGGAEAARGSNPGPLGSGQPITEADLLQLEWVADPRLSPHGDRVAFTRVWVDQEADAYRTRIMLVDVAGGEARPLTAGSLDSQPRWSPDGKQLAFVRGEEGKPSQLCVLPMSGGEAIQLTDMKKSVSEPIWSPDGKRLAFLSGTNPALDTEEKPKPKNEACRVVTRPVFRMDNEGFIDPDHHAHLWVMDATGGTPRQITCGAFDEQLPVWSRDGKWLLFVSDRRAEPWFGADHADLWAVSPETESPTDGAGLRKVAEFTGPIYAFTEGEDGRFAMIGSVLPETPRSYDRRSLLISSGPWPQTLVRDLGRDHDFDFGESIGSDQHPPRGGGAIPLAFAAGGREIVVTVGRHGAAMLCRVLIENGAVEEMTDTASEVLHGTATPDGKRWALTAGDVEQPVTLRYFEVGGVNSRCLHDANRALLSARALGSVEEFWYPSFDGQRIQGWIVKPPGFDPAKRYPMILEIHGGPHTAYGASFYHEFQVLASAGYVVLYTNPRGSTTYGQEFGNVIQYRYPGDDHLDLMAGVDALIARGYIDSERLGITGGSGGGLLTNWAIAKTDRFKAAVTQRCVSDWAAMYYSCDFTLFEPNWFRKPPFEDPQEYAERSPATFASNIHTPLMVIHSEDDWRTPIGQGETMFRALLQQRKRAVMVRFPGEGHELSRSGAPSRRVQRLEHIRNWFDLYLLGKPNAAYDA